MPTISELVVKITGDTSDLTKKTLEAGRNIAAFGDKAIGAGKQMTAGITVPAIAAAAAMIKLASDTGESLNAASVVFKGSTDTIKAWGKNAATQAGLTSAEFYQASAVIGAGLINAGASAKEASKQTIELTKRAADMASIFNTSVDDALGALQAGLRGESEPLRRFAVSLNEADVAARAISMGLVDGDGAVTAYGKSQARLALIMEQSSKFQGDFVNTSDQLANKTRIVTAQVKEQAAELGQQLLPLVLDLVTNISELVDKFSALSDEQKETILKTVAVAAAVGPLLITVGQATKAVSGLRTAFMLLSAAGGGPVALAIAGLAAIGAAAGIFISNLKEAQKEFQKLQTVMSGGTTGTLASDLKVINDEIATIKARIGSSEGLIPDETKELEAELKKVEAVRFALIDKAKRQGLSLAASTALVKKAEEEVKTAEDIEAIQARKVALEKKYSESRATVLSALESEKTEYQKIQDQIDKISKTPWATGELEEDRKAAIEALRKRQLEIIDEEAKARADAVGDLIVREAELEDARLAAIEENKKAEAERNEEILDGIDMAEAAFSSFSESAEETLLNLLDLAATTMIKSGDSTTAMIGMIVKAATVAYNAIDGLFNAQKKSADSLRDTMLSVQSQILSAQLEANEIALNSKLAKLDAELQAELVAAGYANEIDETKLTDREKIELKYAKKKAEAEAEAAKAQRKLAYDQAVLNKQIALIQTQIDEKAALSELGWFASKKDKAAVSEMYAQLAAAITAIPLPALARGSDFTKAGLTRINEEGGEVVNMPAGASVTPATRTPMTGNGVTVNINSPMAVNPSEAATIFTRTARDLAFQGVL